MNGSPIGVFDSGVGGLSVLLELEHLMPYEDFVFVADQKNVPYGGKTKAELIARATAISEYLISNQKTKAVVVACNTATCYAIEEVRKIFPDTPFIGTEPALKPAAEYSKNGVVGVLSTPATSRSETLTRLIRLYAPDKTVLRIGCEGLEDAVEIGELDSPKVRELLLKYVGLALANKADSLVLGCTHYPFLRKQIQEITGPDVKLFDSGAAIARRTYHLLDEVGLLAKLTGRGKIRLLTTGDSGQFGRVAAQLMKRMVITANIDI